MLSCTITKGLCVFDEIKNVPISYLLLSFFQKWTENLVDDVRIQKDMDRVPIPKSECDCAIESHIKDEL